MLRKARELAARGHRMQMIEAVLSATGYPESAEFMEQRHIHSSGPFERQGETKRAIRES